MKTIMLSTFLPASPDVVWDHVTRSALLHYVAAGFVSFRPNERRGFPERWTDGEHKTSMLLWGVVPLGWQIIRTERLPARGATRALRDNGYGAMIKTWDHVIKVWPDGPGTRYLDRVTIDAGVLTPFVALFAQAFYRHRQSRWRRLVANDFNYAR
jgi:hypothetical protein